ncbi:MULTISPECIES: threonine synthase [unclassified Psychrobacillus]|jgi:threonine synthase|uniref:threonine synthase n=1 Tax=unclassified Psychrobacillus TaxID=2636677 RepID=UPI0012459E1F|nr:threonine synthase [Psychrobacillus sp. AK 1817]QEY21858.1 threonine synthase [Psychrobacillus sp. AK 1817]
MAWQGLIEQYKEFLPVTENTPKLTLLEGNTPLIKLENLSNELGIELYAKIEGANPTGSFKDRGMVFAVAKAKEEGSKAVICASTGNTSAAAAAYAARAGMRAVIVIPEGKVAAGKLAQAYMYGAEVIQIEGNFDVALEMVRAISESSPITLVNSVNPYRIEGQKTASFEICDVLGSAPDYLAIPVGNAGNITAYWKGFKEYNEKKQTGLPKIYGFEAEGAAAIVQGKPIEFPETIATAIRIGNPASWDYAVAARDESQGLIEAVSDDEMLDAYKLIASREGIFAEPASCASIAGVIRSVKEGKIIPGSKVVAVLTGNGLKDPQTAIDVKVAPPHKIESNAPALSAFIEGVLA